MASLRSRWALLLAAWLLSSASAQAAPVRVAIGPYFPPPAGDALRATARALPELLTVELSREARFQLLDRDKVQALLTELNLGAAGFSSRNGVARLGQVLSCDWVVSGSIVQTEARTVAWTKVIDIRSGVVLDLQATPVGRDQLPLAVSNITRFLNGVGTTAQSRDRQFVALGRIVDMRPWLSIARQDWSRRMAAVIERQAQTEGFGVVEMEAVTPLFEERRLAAAPGQTDEPVKLQSAFWLVDGGCKWIEGKPERLEFGLRVQRVGGPEQRVTFTAAPGEAAEEAIQQQIRRALADTNRIAAATAARAEVELMTARGVELSNLRLPFMVDRRPDPPTDANMERLEQEVQRGRSSLENQRRAVANYQRTLLLDPTNTEVKYSLASVTMLTDEPDARKRGEEMMKEIAASKDTKWGPRAELSLSRSGMMRKSIGELVERRQQASDQLEIEQLIASNPFDWEAKLKLGVLLLGSDRGFNRGRAETLLQEVASCGNDVQATRARGTLPLNASPVVAARVQYDAGTRLLQSRSGEDRERAVRLLTQVSQGPVEDLAELAGRRLPPAGMRMADFHPPPLQTLSWGQYTPSLAGVAPRLMVVGGVVPFDLCTWPRSCC